MLCSGFSIQDIKSVSRGTRTHDPRICFLRLYFCALNQLNVLIYSEIEFFYKTILLTIIKTVSRAKISSPEINKGYSSYPQKHILAKYLIFLGKDFVRSLIFYSKSIGVSEEINLR